MEVVAMRGRARVQGQPINPLLALLALGIFFNVVLLDAGAIIVDFSFFGLVAFWSMLAGLFAALPAAVIAVLDMLAAPTDAPIRSKVLRYGLADLVVVGLFAVVWFGRLAGDRTGNGWFLAVETLGLAVGVTGFWLARRAEAADEVAPARRADREKFLPEPRAGAGVGSLQTVRLSRRPWAAMDSTPDLPRPRAAADDIDAKDLDAETMVIRPAHTETQPSERTVPLAEATEDEPEPEEINDELGETDSAETELTETELTEAESTEAEPTGAEQVDRDRASMEVAA
jgi:uncharacterized membrane protein